MKRRKLVLVDRITHYCIELTLCLSIMTQQKAMNNESVI